MAAQEPVPPPAGSAGTAIPAAALELVALRAFEVEVPVPFLVHGKEVNLSPGMAVTVEVKTGRRRVIEYFLSPLLQHADESLGER